MTTKLAALASPPASHATTLAPSAPSPREPAQRLGANRSGPNRSRVAAAWLAATFLAACGGGGGDAAPAPSPAPVNTSSWSLEQARKVAARTINAAFVADEVATLAVLPSFVRTLSGVPVASFNTLCASGTGTGVFTDVDASNSFTAGDFTTFAFNGCVPLASSPWSLTGAPVSTLVGGSNIVSFLSGGVGQLTVRLAPNGVAFAPGYALNGAWTIASENLSPTTSVATITMAGVNLTLGSAAVSIPSLQFNADNTRLTALSGRVASTVAGLGAVDVTLSMPTPLVLAATSSARVVPVSGTVRLTAATWTMEVEYGAAGGVTLRLDEGANGSVELTLTTSVAELDALLGTV